MSTPVSTPAPLNQLSLRHLNCVCFAPPTKKPAKCLHPVGKMADVYATAGNPSFAQAHRLPADSDADAKVRANSKSARFTVAVFGSSSCAHPQNLNWEDSAKTAAY